MKIKYRITFLFTLVVTCILFLVCVSVYYFSNLNRQLEFRKRLKFRAITTVSLLMKVRGIDTELLKKIDQTTLLSLQQKSVFVYDLSGKEIYGFTDNNVIPVKADGLIFDKLKYRDDYSFAEKGKDVVAIKYINGNNIYFAIAAAFDKDGFDKLDQLKFILSLSFISGILITFLSGIVFSIRLVSPIKKIADEVKEISSQNLSRRIDINKPEDELYELSSTFNELLNRLQESFEIQRRFIANASHELSTPLTSVLSQLEITLQNERDINEYKEVIYSVYEDVKNLTMLTKSLLEMAKASGSSGGIELLLIRIDELLMKLPSALRKADTRYIVELHFDIFPENEDKLLVFGNADLLYSAISNVVENACKYSPGQLANVSLNFFDDYLQIIVEDNGPGIAERDLPFIFQPFYRGEDAVSKQGFGLGLSMAYRIIKLHKGTIEAVNIPNIGTMFYIKLPIAQSFHAI